jgi:hypothetical protein
MKMDEPTIRRDGQPHIRPWPGDYAMNRLYIAAVFTVLTPILALAADEPQDDDLNTQLMRATVKISHDKSTGTGFVLTKAKKSARTFGKRMEISIEIEPGKTCSGRR